MERMRERERGAGERDRERKRKRERKRERGKERERERDSVHCELCDDTVKIQFNVFTYYVTLCKRIIDS